MSSLHHSFDTLLAEKYGLEEAILIHHFQHWIAINKRMGRNNHEGKTWMYQTQDKMAAHFPYWKNRVKVKRLIKRLIDLKVIIKGNFNRSAYDRTSWYAFADENKFIQGVEYDPSLDDKSDQCIGQKRPMEETEATNGLDESDRPIPDTKTDTKTNTKDITSEPAFQLAESLFSSILKNNPKAKTPNLQSWAKEIGRIITLDGKSAEDIQEILDWLPSNAFWEKNILSANSLRKQFDRLIAEMRSESKSGIKNKNSMFRSFEKQYKPDTWRPTPANRPKNKTKDKS